MGIETATSPKQGERREKPVKQFRKEIDSLVARGTVAVAKEEGKGELQPKAALELGIQWVTLDIGEGEISATEPDTALNEAAKQGIRMGRQQVLQRLGEASRGDFTQGKLFCETARLAQKAWREGVTPRNLYLEIILTTRKKQGLM